MIIKDLGGKSHWGDIKSKQTFKKLNRQIQIYFLKSKPDDKFSFLLLICYEIFRLNSNLEPKKGLFKPRNALPHPHNANWKRSETITFNSL